MNYQKKYLKYKQKYLELKQIGGVKCMDNDVHFSQHNGECWHDSILTIFFFCDVIGDNIQYIIFSNSVDDILDITQKTYQFLFPIHIEYNDIKKVIYLFKEYIINIKNRFNLKMKSQNQGSARPLLKRSDSFRCSIDSAIIIRHISDIVFMTKRVNTELIHGGTIIDILIAIQTINYFFQINNNFINTFIINDIINLKFISIELLNKTNAICISIHYPVSDTHTTSDEHAVCLYKCEGQYMYYDDNGINYSDKGTVIYSTKFDWYNLIKKHISNGNLNQLFENLMLNIKKLYKIPRSYLTINYSIREIIFIYEDTFVDEIDYYKKISQSFSYLFIYYNNINQFFDIRLPELKRNRDIMLSAVYHNGMMLEYVILDLNDDRKIVETAITQNGLALQYASSNLKADRVIVETAITQNGLALKYTSYDLQNDREIAIAAISQNSFALQYLSCILQSDREIVMSVILQNGLAIQYLSSDLQYDQKIVLAAVKQNGLSLQYLSSKLKNNLEIVYIAVSQNIMAVKYASKELQTNTYIEAMIRAKSIIQKVNITSAKQYLTNTVNSLSDSLPDLSLTLPDLSKTLPDLPDLSKTLPELPDLSKTLPDLSKTLSELPDLSKTLPDLSKTLPKLPDLSKTLPDFNSKDICIIT